jgi:hypothetical protein
MQTISSNFAKDFGFRKFFQATLIACAGLLGHATAQAQTVLFSNLSPNITANGVSACVGNSGVIETGVRLETPSGNAVLLQTIKVRLNIQGSGDPAATVTLSVRADNAGQPGALISSAGTLPVAGLGTTETYEFTPSAPISIAAATQFWVVANGTTNLMCAVNWHGYGNPSVGTLAYLGGAQLFMGVWDLTSFTAAPANQFSIEILGPVALPVPVPVPVNALWMLLAMMATLVGAAVYRGKRGRG